ncbi:hypothetical protein [Pantoea sp. BAV 3049]|uniref:hypothetical protein n=1 Tax=Pantoea sp. BAV 3049 TaxID=2654188 RepID=UPI00131B5BA4|nr:hypothetical protein [Pantoea sp. BAV 3049]
MSVPSQTPYNIHTGNGVTTVFAFGFLISYASDLQVSINGNVVASGYTVSGAGNTSGGSVTFLTSPASGAIVTLLRAIPLNRTTSYQDNGDLLAATINADFDRIWMVLQGQALNNSLALMRPWFNYNYYDALGYGIKNLATPTADQDATTKKYVDDLLAEEAAAREEAIGVDITRTLRLAPGLQFNQLQSPASLRGRLLYFDEQTGQPNPIIPAEMINPDVLDLQAFDGLKNVGQCPNIATLRQIEPAYAAQQIFVREYADGTGRGGGTFKYIENDTTTADDGGYFIVTTGGARWKRTCTPEMLNAEHFGAVMDGVTDDMPAVKRMYYATVALNPGNPVGVRLPAGSIALSSTFDLSAATEQPLFRLRGPEVENGAVPATRIYFLDAASSTPVFQVNARRMEIGGLHLVAAGTVTPFYKNVCPAGQYIRVKSFRTNSNGGLVFDVLDTIDTKFDQIYCYGTSGGFLRALWTNTAYGVWDHSTAIEISNSNFSSNTTVDVLQMIRCGQSLMHNVWFSGNEYTFDISQGGWKFDTVIMEGSTFSAKTKWAKILQINCRFAQGATMDNTLSGYTDDMDHGASIPSWVYNAMDQGEIKLNTQGSAISGGLAAGFRYSQTVLQNTNNVETWFYVGRMTLPSLGRTAIMRFVGAAGWDSAAGAITRPGDTRFGGGETKLFVEMKQPNSGTTSVIEAHWYSEGSAPVKEIRIVHSWQTIHVYVRIAQYARYTGVFVECNGVPRIETGTPFYLISYNTQITDINAIANNVTVPRRWAINAGGYDDNGFGMDLDSGELLIYSTSLVASGASTWLPTRINGELKNVQYQDFPDALRCPRFTYAELPAAPDRAYCLVLCTDTTRSPPMQLLYSYDGMWFPVNNPGDAWRPA